MANALLHPYYHDAAQYILWLSMKDFLNIKRIAYG